MMPYVRTLVRAGRVLLLVGLMAWITLTTNKGFLVQAQPVDGEGTRSAAEEQSAWLEWSAVPFESGGMLMVPVADAFGWFGAQSGADSKARFWEAAYQGMRIRVRLKDGEETALVNGSEVALPRPVTRRRGKFFIPLRWVSTLYGSSLGDMRIPGAVVIATDNGQRFLPRFALPHRRVGLCCWVGHIRGESPDGRSILQHVRTALVDELARQGIEAVEVPNVAASLRRGMKATIVAAYQENSGGMYLPSGGHGTNISLEVVCKDESGKDVGQFCPLYASSPSTIVVMLGESPTAPARIRAVEEFLENLRGWQCTPPAISLWRRHAMRPVMDADVPRPGIETIAPIAPDRSNSTDSWNRIVPRSRREQTYREELRQLVIRYEASRSQFSQELTVGMPRDASALLAYRTRREILSRLKRLEPAPARYAGTHARFERLIIQALDVIDDYTATRDQRVLDRGSERLGRELQLLKQELEMP